MGKKEIDIVAAGHVCLDIIPKFPDGGLGQGTRLFEPGRLYHVEAAQISTGGPVSNTGIALKKLGMTVAFIARVGKDPFGELVRQKLMQQGSVEGILEDPEDRTSYTIAIAPPGVDRIFFHDPGANDRFSSGDVNRDTVSRARLFHFGYPPLMKTCYSKSGEELRNIFQMARTSGALTTLDMALPDPSSPSGKAPWKSILERVLPLVDVFLPSVEELYFMLEPDEYLSLRNRVGAKDMIDAIPHETYRDLAKTALGMGPSVMVLKTAHRGLYCRTAFPGRRKGWTEKNLPDPQNWSDREIWCPAFQVRKIASATGSGDSSIAGFLAAFLRGYSIERSLKIANQVGFQNLHTWDATSGIRDWDETIRRVDHGHLETIPLPLKDPDWLFSPEDGIWLGSADSHFRHASENNH